MGNYGTKIIEFIGDFLCMPGNYFAVDETFAKIYAQCKKIETLYDTFNSGRMVHISKMGVKL